MSSVTVPGPAATPARRAPRRPGSERQVTALSIVLAAIFLALALAAVVWPQAALGSWLPVHLLLAGAASTAIAGVMPFFSAAVASTAPAPAWLRVAAVAGVAAGAGLATLGRVLAPALATGAGWLAGMGGLVFIAGLCAVAAATLLPLRRAIGGRRLLIGWIYGSAVLNVMVGATLASLLLLGWLPAAQSWDSLKPAHAWLNIFGFVSLVIGGTLLHLFPTIVGARIGRTRAAEIAIVALTTAPLVTAVGFIIESTVMATVGAIGLVGGAAALAAHMVSVGRRGASWTTDPGWHRFTTWSLALGTGWFVVGSAIAAWQVTTAGSAAGAWQMAPLVAPLGIGWVAQVLVGAWSHLIPAVGPGSPARHARQRRILGSLSLARLAALNVGVAIALVGHALAMDATTVAGLALCGLALLGALALLAMALLRSDHE